ncbi:alpha/beta fold hydrolase [Actinomadura scrupuli]|uniref:alpha/beta fold hydrolase n=1 Tax=Actinomadura scrupuli TaxID=559629 RepID=UPI003D99C551
MSSEVDPFGVQVAHRSGTFDTPDGRTVAFSHYGSEGDARAVFLYGTPGTRLLSPQSLAALSRRGVQLLVLDRPGYAESTRRPGRRVVDVVDDVVRLVDLHGWSRFAVWGGSGGAPHALACAAVLPGRVDRCASVVGPAPFDAEGLDWFGGMSAGNVEEFSRAASGEESYRPLVERLAAEALAAVDAGEPPVSPDHHLPEADIRALRARIEEPGHSERFRAAYADGVDGWIDDCIAMTRPWGIDLSGIRIPVSVWYGPDDVLSPRGHAEWLPVAPTGRSTKGTARRRSSPHGPGPRRHLPLAAPVAGNGPPHASDHLPSASRGGGARAGHRSRTSSPWGREQQTRTLPSAGSCTGSGE